MKPETSVFVVSVVMLGFFMFKCLQLLNASKTKSDIIPDLLDLNNSNRSRLNCLTSAYFCETDADCDDICAPNKSALFMCDKNAKICSPKDADDDGPGTRPKNCNKRIGFIPVLTSNQLTGLSWSCANTLPTIFDNDGNFLPHVCASGRFPVDISTKYPDTSDCVCGDGFIKVNKEDDINTPRCIKKGMFKFMNAFKKV